MKKGFRKFNGHTLKVEYVITGKGAKRRARETARHERKHHAHVRTIKRKPGIYAIYTSAWAR